MLKAGLASTQAAKTLAEQPFSEHAAAAASALVELAVTEAGRRAVATALTCVRRALPALADLVKVGAVQSLGFIRDLNPYQSSGFLSSAPCGGCGPRSQTLSRSLPHTPHVSRTYLQNVKGLSSNLYA